MADSKADQGGRYRFLSREAMACTRIIGVSPGSPFPGGIRYGMIRFWSTKTHDESTGLSESGRKCENGVDVEGHAVFSQRHSPLGGEHIPVSLDSCPLKRTMTGIEVCSRIIIFSSS